MRTTLKKIAIGSTLSLLCVVGLASPAEAGHRDHGERGVEIRIGPDFRFGWFDHRAAERMERRRMHDRARLLDRVFEAVEYGELRKARRLFRRARMIRLDHHWSGWPFWSPHVAYHAQEKTDHQRHHARRKRDR